MKPEIVTLPDAAAVAAAGAERVRQAAIAAVAERGRFVLSLAGGRTPRALYEQLAANSTGIDWARTHLIFGDERPVPPDHADSNYRMVREALLDAVPIPPEQVHRFAGERDPKDAAASYRLTLDRLFDGESGRIDLSLLGMGADGHTASLFPGTTALTERDLTAVAVWVPQHETDRLTLTLRTLCRARATLLLVTGADKADAVRRALTDPEADLPVQQIRPDGTLTWLLDVAAASGLQASQGSQNAGRPLANQ